MVFRTCVHVHAVVYQPGPISNIHFTTSRTSITMTWSPPDAVVPVSSYEVTYILTTFMDTVITSVPQFVLAPLPPQTMVIFNVRAIGLNGKIGPMELVLESTSRCC